MKLGKAPGNPAFCRYGRTYQVKRTTSPSHNSAVGLGAIQPCHAVASALPHGFSGTTSASISASGSTTAATGHAPAGPNWTSLCFAPLRWVLAWWVSGSGSGHRPTSQSRCQVSGLVPVAEHPPRCGPHRGTAQGTGPSRSQGNDRHRALRPAPSCQYAPTWWHPCMGTGITSPSAPTAANDCFVSVPDTAWIGRSAPPRPNAAAPCWWSGTPRWIILTDLPPEAESLGRTGLQVRSGTRPEGPTRLPPLAGAFGGDAPGTRAEAPMSCRAPPRSLLPSIATGEAETEGQRRRSLQHKGLWRVSPPNLEIRPRAPENPLHTPIRAIGVCNLLGGKWLSGTFSVQQQ